MRLALLRFCLWIHITFEQIHPILIHRTNNHCRKCEIYNRLHPLLSRRRHAPRAPCSLVLGSFVNVACATFGDTLNDRGTIAEAGAEEDVGVREETFLEGNDDELRALEAVAEQLPDVLRVREVERRVDFVEDVHWRGLELEERHDERKCNERPGEGT